MKKKLSKYEQLIANLNKASQDLKDASTKAIATLDAHANKVEAIHQEAMTKWLSILSSSPLPLEASSSASMVWQHLKNNSWRNINQKAIYNLWNKT